MAGEGGFKTAIQGFDKKEVNEYISNLRKTMKEMEAEKHANEEKTAAAVKIAEAAEGRIKAAEEKAAEKIAELEIQAKTERRNAESLTIQIDELKRKLKHQPTAAGGKVDVSAAQKQSADIISRANKTAQDIVEKAKKTAQDIVARAQSAASAASASGGAAGKDVEAFMKVLKDCLNNITENCGELGKKASELLAAGSAPVSVHMPDFSDISAPKAAVPPSRSEPTVSSEPEMTLTGNLFENMDESSDDMSFDFGKEDVAPINPKTPKAEVVEGFDLSGFGAHSDMSVDNVAPIDTDNLGKAEMDNDFAKELIAQTVPSSALGNDADADLVAAVKQEEERFAVKPSDDKDLDFNMDMDDNAADNSAADDPMAALLAQAQAAFGGGGGFDMSEPEPERESEPSMGMGSSGDWADLQKQLEAMEKSGSFGGETEPEAPAEEPPKNIADDPKAPNADDSAIWNFGDFGSGSSDDDDMSSDLFGSF